MTCSRVWSTRRLPGTAMRRPSSGFVKVCGGNAMSQLKYGRARRLQTIALQNEGVFHMPQNSSRSIARIPWFESFRQRSMQFVGLPGRPSSSFSIFDTRMEYRCTQGLQRLMGAKRQFKLQFAFRQVQLTQKKRKLPRRKARQLFSQRASKERRISCPPRGAPVVAWRQSCQ